MNDQSSSYLQHLPQIFRTGGGPGGTQFLGRFLKIFEALLSGRDDARPEGEKVAGLEERIAGFPAYLDPLLTPVDDPDAEPALTSEFLDYLARWVGLMLDQNWTLAQKREWQRRIVPLYKRRGTRDGLAEYLAMFIGNQASIDEPPGGFVLGWLPTGEKGTSTLGVDTFIAGAPAYFFRVRINYGFGAEPFEIATWRNIRKGTRAIVDIEKPAHTYYTLDARTPGFSVGIHSTIGQDTLIWQNSQMI